MQPAARYGRTKGSKSDGKSRWSGGEGANVLYFTATYLIFIRS